MTNAERGALIKTLREMTDEMPAVDAMAIVTQVGNHVARRLEAEIDARIAAALVCGQTP